MHRRLRIQAKTLRKPVDDVNILPLHRLVKRELQRSHRILETRLRRHDGTIARAAHPMSTLFQTPINNFASAHARWSRKPAGATANG